MKLKEPIICTIYQDRWYVLTGPTVLDCDPATFDAEETTDTAASLLAGLRTIAERFGNDDSGPVTLDARLWEQAPEGYTCRWSVRDDARTVREAFDMTRVKLEAGGMTTGPGRVAVVIIEPGGTSGGGPSSTPPGPQFASRSAGDLRPGTYRGDDGEAPRAEPMDPAMIEHLAGIARGRRAAEEKKQEELAAQREWLRKAAAAINGETPPPPPKDDTGGKTGKVVKDDADEEEDDKDKDDRTAAD